ncbi:MAG: O-antigen ligase family protein [Pseudomonadota bacterium]
MSKTLPFKFSSNLGWGPAQFRILWAFLVVAFLLGGSARGDVQSLIVLRPLSVFVCGLGLWTLSMRHLRQYRAMFGLAAAFFVVIGIQLIPLPPSIWTTLPGRELIKSLDQAAGLGDVWRPISLFPSGTENALYSLFTPLAVLILGAQLEREQQQRLLPLMIGLGIISLLLGLLQIAGSSDSNLYLYDVSNKGSPIGVFSNRNHAAVFLACLLPMLAVYASTNIQTAHQARFRLGLGLITAVVVIPLILVAGSRAGMIVAIVGLAAIPLLFRKPAVLKERKVKKRKFNPIAVLGIVGVCGLTLLFALFSRAESLGRLLAYDGSEDLRSRIWGPIADISWKYFPAGSGFGSFADVFQLHEPSQLLKPTYVNHAHNDLLEMYMTGGILGVALLGAIAIMWAIASYRAWRHRQDNVRGLSMARMGSVIFIMLGIASVADYPLRVPSMMCFIVVVALWLKSSTAPKATATEVANGVAIPPRVS